MTQSTTTIVQACLNRMLNGDSSAQAELLAAANDRLMKLARQMFRAEGRLRRWEDTGDVLQAAMLRLLRRLQSVTPTTPREFFSIAAGEIRRALIDLARHYFGPEGDATRQEPLEKDSKDHDPPDPEQNAEQLAEWGEFHTRIDSLPAEELEVFELLWYQGLSQVEAAEVLDVSTRTIKRRWQAACLKLEEALEGRLPPSNIQ